MPKTIVRAADYQERQSLTRCICGGTLHKEPGTLYGVTLVCDTCDESVFYTVQEWAAYDDPMDEVD